MLKTLTEKVIRKLLQVGETLQSGVHEASISPMCRIDIEISTCRTLPPEENENKRSQTHMFPRPNVPGVWAGFLRTLEEIGTAGFSKVEEEGTPFTIKVDEEGRDCSIRAKKSLL